MKYIVFVSIPTKLEVDALNEEDAVQKVRDSLIAAKQIFPASPVEIVVAKDVPVDN